MSLASPSSGLDDSQRSSLATLADALIPGGKGLPPASAVGVQGKWIDRVLDVRPDLGLSVAAVIEQGRAGDPEAVLDRLKTSDRGRFDDFTLAVSGAYFLSPRVRKVLGFPGRAPASRPAYPDESDLYLDGGALLEPVLSRGPIYRATPGGSDSR